MAVYTELSQTEISNFLASYGWPSVVEIKATDNGVENTNYFVTVAENSTSNRELVLTIFENQSTESLPYYVALLTLLGDSGLPVPRPFTDQHNNAIQHLKGKPALLVPRLPGAHIAHPNSAQCAAIGKAMAQIHLASKEFSPRQENLRGPQWRLRLKSSLEQHLTPEQFTLLGQQVDAWQTDLAELNELPQGITHGDLFHDNALFLENHLSGIIDFYNACHDVLLFDLAVLVNDWCSAQNGDLDPVRYEAVVEAYQSIRPLNAKEKAFWPKILGYAALRFWLSRLESWHRNHRGASVFQKNPAEMECLLKNRLQYPCKWL